MDLKALINTPTSTLLDVREYSELINDGTVSGAIHIPMNEIPNKLKEIKTFTVPLIVFCRSGIRSEHIVNYLKKKNFKEIYNGGGFKKINELKEMKS